MDAFRVKVNWAGLVKQKQRRTANMPTRNVRCPSTYGGRARQGNEKFLLQAAHTPVTDGRTVV
jgi:hypothetical protein